MNESIKVTIERVVRDQTSANWLIVHTIARKTLTNSDIEFSFVDGKERRDEPFGTNQGYLCLNSQESVHEVNEAILALAKTFENNTIALANLYITTSRISYSAEDDEGILSALVKILDAEVRHATFKLLIESLNNSYYKDHQLFSENPVDVESWLSLFNSVDYLHPISNPVPLCLKLVISDRSRVVDFSTLRKMKPLLRAVLMGQYGYDLTISEQELSAYYESEGELIFLAACLLDNMDRDKEPAHWLNKNLVVAMMKRWELIGKQMFIHVFGISYRNKNSNKTYGLLGNLIHEVLFAHLMLDQNEIREWLGKLEFPNGFIAFFWWLKSKGIDVSQIPEANAEKVSSQFLTELDRIIDSSPEYFVDDRSSDPFATYQLSEEKYGFALVYILFFLIYSSEENISRFKSTCMRVKPFFYGAYQARLFAIRFTEVMLLIFLSADSISSLDEIGGKSIKKYLKVISDTLLVSYIHLEERDDEVWNPESEKQVFDFRAGRYLVTTAMKNVRKHQVREYYKDFFDSINEVAIAKWG